MATFKMNKVGIIPKSLKKNNNLVYVIRKKNIPHLSWWENRGDTYYSSILKDTSNANDKRSIYSFMDNKSAMNCLSFINKYKSVNNKYPDDSGDSDDSDGMLYVDTEPVFYLQNKCLLNGLGLIGITTFEYTFCKTFLDKNNVFNLTVSGIDLLEGYSLEVDYIDHLNHLLEF